MYRIETFWPLVALVGAIVASPFLLARSVHRHSRSGRAKSAHIAQARVNEASALRSAGRQAAVPLRDHPDQARAVLDEVQAAPIDKLPVEDRWITVPADGGAVRVRIV